MEMPRVGALAIAVTLIFVNLTGQCSGELEFGFYNGRCKDIRTGKTKNVEDIVKQKVEDKFSKDSTIVAALLRMQFHDCFVNGCDASILLNVSGSESTAPPNLSVRGYEFIEDIKAEIENTCPDLVSCADIIVMATRDAVFLSNQGWRYPVQTGRKDGTRSSATDVNLPSPRIPIDQAIKAFKDKGLNATDMVYLVGGGHSVGVAHCGLFEDRLYNFNSSGRPDQTMNKTLLSKLQNLCPQNSGSINTTDLDQNPSSSFVVDKSFYNQILSGNGILQVDQQLALRSETDSIVKTIVNSNDFFFKFGLAMIKLGAVDVKIGTDGEIRKKCGDPLNPSNGNFGGFGNIFG